MAGKLTAFLADRARRHNVRLVVSERFCDDGGEPALWEIAPLSAGDMRQVLAEFASRQASGARVRREDVLLKLLTQAVVWPDLQDAELQDSYGVLGAEELLLRMLSPGEYGVLQGAFVELNMRGGLQERLEEAKN